MFRQACPSPLHWPRRPRNSAVYLLLQRLANNATTFVPAVARTMGTLPRLPIFESIVRHDPDSTSVIHSQSGRRFTYADLTRDVAKERSRLLPWTGAEANSGKRIAFLMENSYDYVVTVLSIFGSHAIAVPLPPAFPVQSLQYLVEQSQPVVLLASSKFLSKAQAIVAKCEAGQAPHLIHLEQRKESPSVETVKLEDASDGKGGLMLYTSGTTNRPKGVFLPQSAITAQARSLLTAWRYSANDHILHVLPMHHIHGMVNALLTPLFAGATIEFMFPFNATAVWERFAAPYLTDPPCREKITFFTAVPTIYNRLLTSYPQLPLDLQPAAQRGISPASLRLNLSGSAALPTPTKKAWSDLSGGNVLLERYGMTEVGMALSCGLDLADRVDGSVGWPLPGVEVRLVDTETGEIIEHGAERDANGRERDGEIQLRGPTLFQEYFRNREATQKEHVDAEDGCARWFKTGDIAVRRCVESAGHSDQTWARGPLYFIRGRKSADIIKSGGEKISALEVERELLSHPQVSEAAVLAVPSGAWGQKVGAVVILRPDAEGNMPTLSPMDMRRFLRDRLANYQIPQILRVVEHIPRNEMGKINKKELVKIFFDDSISGDESSRGGT
ncbi:unnamed protein product [Blumeria hordei]|uniref:Uncharacterized protein n=1 Tax=Blumeria hordei TaxID=2867405 RepID=A0A383UM08_BLUHO|nr:unnamed protein product [Blumeria hordei]